MTRTRPIARSKTEPTIKKPKRAEVSVRAIASSGAGVADLPDGRVVFVPRTVPGDVARISIVKNQSRWAAGSLERLVEAGPHRVTPECALYAECGGCQLQHLAYEQQLEWKGRFVSDALRRIGGLDDVEPPAVVPSPDEYGYRDRLSYTLRRLRDGHVLAGFHALGRPAHVLDVHEECRLPRPELRAAWTRLRAAWGAPDARFLPMSGRLRLTLRSTVDGVELVVEGGPSGWNASALLDAGADLSAVWHVPQEEATPRLVGGMSRAGGGTAFAQVNAPAAALLRDQVARAWADMPAGRAVDAYCGVGDYGRVLANQGWTVTGIEIDAAAVAAAKEHDTERFSVLETPVEAALFALLPCDLLIVNPPRSGLHADLPPAISASPPERIIYVSCDPATLARDVAALSASHSLSSLAAFDLFPQTAHVETVAVLQRLGGVE